MMFNCKKCGECCKHIGGIEIYKDLDNGKGECKYLVDNLCSIYEKRPLKCRVDDAYKEWFSDVMKKETYYRINYMVCESLQKEGKGD